MTTANLRAVAHDGGDFIQALAFHGKMASKGVPEIQAAPLQSCFLVYLAQVLGKIVRMPAATCRRGKEPVAGNLGGMGRAMRAGASEYGSTAIKLQDGSTVYINVTDAFGNVMLKGAEKVVQKLRKSGVREEKEIKEINRKIKAKRAHFGN